MAAKRGKTRQATRKGSSTSGKWVWLLGGSAVTAGIFLAAPLVLKKNPPHFLHALHPDTALQHPAPADRTPAHPSRTQTLPAPGGAHPRFDFYTVLPGTPHSSSPPAPRQAPQHTVVPDTGGDHADNEQARAQAALNNMPMPPRVPGRAASTEPATGAQATQQAGTGHAADSPAEHGASRSASHYVLQAGAFGAQPDAESIKARAAMLGLNARVEPVHTPGHPLVYRVRLGPYASSEELSAARQKLHAGGLHAIAILQQ